MSDAIAGKYAVLERATDDPPTIWETIEEVFSIGDLTQRFSLYDVTSHGPSAYREVIPGLFDLIEIDLEMNYIWLQYEIFKGYADARVPYWWRLNYQDGSKHTFSAYVVECSPKTPLDDRITYAVTLAIDGAITSTNP